MTRPAWHDASLAAALARTPLVARRVGTGVSEGRHASRLPGTGLEFAQYRGYQPGDDPRRVDWKLLARSDRFYVREADAETSMHVRLLLDASGSMAHAENGVSKFDAARAIVAALAEAAIRNGDVPSLVVAGETEAVVPPSRDRRQLERIIDTLDRAVPRGTLGHPDAAVNALGGNDGMLVAITDWHDPADTLRPALERSGLDATLLVLRTALEQDAGYGRAVTLEDLETGERVVMDGAAVAVRAAVLARRTQAARGNGIDVVTLDPTTPIAPSLTRWLAARAGRR